MVITIDVGNTNITVGVYPFLCAGEADREYGRYQRTYPGTETDREQPQPNSKAV